MQWQHRQQEALSSSLQSTSFVSIFKSFNNLQTYILKAKKVCRTAFSVKQNFGKSAGHFWAILDHFGSFLGHFGPFGVIFGPLWAILWHFWTNLQKVQFFLRDCWGRDPRFKNVCLFFGSGVQSMTSWSRDKKMKNFTFS